MPRAELSTTVSLVPIQQTCTGFVVTTAAATAAAATAAAAATKAECDRFDEATPDVNPASPAI
jgi:hypothetical protein